VPGPGSTRRGRPLTCARDRRSAHATQRGDVQAMSTAPAGAGLRWQAPPAPRTRPRPRRLKASCQPTPLIHIDTTPAPAFLREECLAQRLPDACSGRVPSASTGDRLTLASGSDCESADVVVRHDCWSSRAGAQELATDAHPIKRPGRCSSASSPTASCCDHRENPRIL
jgi:hypothetical protein